MSMRPTVERPGVNDRSALPICDADRRSQTFIHAIKVACYML